VLAFPADEKHVKNPLRRLRIGTRLFLIVLVMMLLTLAVSSFIYSYFESTLIGEIQDQSESLSKALQISVQQMTSEGITDDTLLKDYVERLSSRGVKEISILSNEKEVVASSNPARVRRKTGVRRAAAGSSTAAAVQTAGSAPEGLVLTGTLSEQELGDTRGKTSRELDIPIIVNNEKRGYIRLHLLFDDFSELIRTAHRRRLIALIAVFAAGTAGIAGLSLGLTRSLRELSRAAAQVAEGDLSVRLAPTHQDEAGKVMETFNQMVVRLRDQRVLEERLRRAEHLSAIGNLASAVAHEIRNPLNLISLSVGHLGSSYRPPDPAQAKEYDEVIAAVRDELKRLNGMVSDFLSYGRPPRLVLRACRVEEVLEEVLSLTAARARDQQIEIVRRFSPSLPAVEADPEALKTCFVNVIVNALQAMPGGGRLEIAASCAPAEDGGRTLLVTISDTGGGIAGTDLERIFEPYFTTRDAGVGLGLAITQRILQEHGGRIGVTSAPGSGTSFRIEIPVSGPKTSPRTEEAA
jgi:signal transduction histidine kinase